MKIADLHIHSSYSDGLYSPRELFAKAKAKGFSGIIITDHDNLDSCNEIFELSKEFDIRTLSGCELSCFYEDKEYHLLAYNFDCHNQEFIDVVNMIRSERIARAEKICEQLRNLKVDITIQEILSDAGDSSITRPHIAQILVEKGYVKTSREAFTHYIGDNGPAVSPKYKFQIEDAIKLIHNAGGVSILAHPDKKINRNGFYNLIKIGLDGIEVIHPYITESRSKFLQSIAKQFQLITTAGSDYHGINEWEEYTFGEKYTTDDVFERIIKRSNVYREQSKLLQL